MTSPEEKQKHRQRLSRKRKEKVQSAIAKDLRSPKYKQRVVQDKRGRKHDLDRMSHAEFVEAIQDDDTEFLGG